MYVLSRNIQSLDVEQNLNLNMEVFRVTATRPIWVNQEGIKEAIDKAVPREVLQGTVLRYMFTICYKGCIYFQINIFKKQQILFGKKQTSNRVSKWSGPI